jgi:hypothetical protein
MAQPTKLEAMLLHLLHKPGPSGRPWVSVTVPGYPKFTRDDVEHELYQAKRHWYSWILGDQRPKNKP